MLPTRPAFTPDDAFTQSFATQYISLILFILIFSIAAFLPKDPKSTATESASQVSTPNIQADAKPPTKNIELGRYESSNLFKAGSSEINPDEWYPFESILQQHDVNITLEINWGKKIGLETAIMRAVNARAALNEKDVPDLAVQISIRKSSNESEGQLILVKGAPHE